MIIGWTFCAAGFAILLLHWCFGRQWRAARPLIVYYANAAAIAYLLWRWSCTLPAVGLDARVLLAYSLVVLESLASYIAVSGIEFPSNYLTRPTLKPFFLNGGRRSPLVEAPLKRSEEHPWRVAVLIVTYNEPWEVLEKTLVGVAHLEHDNFKVWVLDDGGRAWLRAKAEANFGYISRCEREHYKAGNINNALRELRANGEAFDFIALFDADFIPRPEFLRRTLALMRDETVGIVQTPQLFYNPDPFQRIFGVKNWPEEQRWWFDIDEPSLDATGGALCCGTACLLRRAALDAIGGGFPTESITEDTLCSVKMKEVGFRTAYLSERLAVGLSAEGLHEWFTQRVRWLRGELRNRRLSGTPTGMFDSVNYWLSYLQLSIQAARDLLWVAALSLYWYSGFWVLETTLAEATAYFVPLWLPTFAWAWLSGGRKNYIVTSAQFKLQRFVWLVVPIMSLFSKSGTVFEVTSKACRRERTVIHWRVLGGHMVVMLALGVGIAFRVLSDPHVAEGDRWFWPLLAVSSFLLLETLVAVAPAIEKPQRRINDRYESSERVRVHADGRDWLATARDISLGGVLLTFPGAAAVPARACLEIAEVGSLWATRVWASGHSAAFAFKHAGLSRMSLIRKLYCTDRYVPLPDAWSLTRGVWAVVTWIVRVPFSWLRYLRASHRMSVSAAASGSRTDGVQ